MPRVLLTGFCAVPGPRRAGVQLRHVVRALTSLHTVDLLVMREGDQGYVERQGSVRVLRVPTQDGDQRSQIQAFQRALRRQLEGADYDIVHCRDAWSGLPVLEGRDRFGYAVVYDLTRSPLGETTGDAELDAQYARDEEACLIAADLVLAPTPAAVKALQRRGRPERILLSPPGVDVDRFDWDVIPRTDPPRILYVGSVDPARGVRVLVKAMASIVREVDARLVLAGPIAPRFEAPLKEAIRELGLAEKVELTGPIDHDQLPALIATASVCVVGAAADHAPNPNVVYPTKLLEYMACRSAIVAPRRDTVAHVVENAREALLFEPGDPLDLARKVLRLLAEPVLRQNLAHHAYERVRRDFTASGARRAIRTAYDKLSARFADRPVEDADEAPRVVMLADDDFEATVLEEVPTPPRDTSLKVRTLPADLIARDEGTGSGTAAPAPAPLTTVVDGRGPDGDETQERRAAPADDGPGRAARDTLAVPFAAPRAAVVKARPDSLAEDVVEEVLDVGDGGDAAEVLEEVVEAGSGALAIAVVEERTDSPAGTPPPDAPAPGADEGTPLEGTSLAGAVRPPSAPRLETAFVAGEIDVPTPPPALREPK